MANVPVNTEHTLVMQNQTTGQVDFLKFNGTTLVSSFLKDYGIAGWTVVANCDFNVDGAPDLVVQNQSTGFLDFLYLNAAGNLIGSALSNVPVPTVHGAGFFGGGGSPSGIDLVSQLANGQLDILAFSAAGTLVRSDLIPGTVGLPTVIGAMDANDPTNFQAFQGVGTGATDEVVVQYPGGAIDVLGFTGNITTGLSFTASFVLPSSAGSPTLSVLDQDFSTFGVDEGTNATTPPTAGALQGVEMVGTVAGQPDLLYFNSGYSDSLAHKGQLVGSLLENFTVPSGWQLVDGGIVAHGIFPIT